MSVPSFLKRIHPLRLLAAAIGSVAVIFICYLYDNSPYSIGGANVGQYIEEARQYFGHKTDSVPDDVYLINVSYDHELIPVIYSDSLPLIKGDIPVTDRSKLVSLLSQLKDTQYRYIILDLLFAKDENSPADSALFALISSMDNVIVATTETAEINPALPPSKLGSCDYSTHLFETNFVKYEYLRHGEPTVPYRVYMDLYGKQFSRRGCFYFLDGRLATKSVVLRLPYNIWNSEKTCPDDFFGVKLLSVYHNLGSEILLPEIDLTEKVKDKIVIVGYFAEDDIHDTYLGPVAGPLVILNAYAALVKGYQYISLWLVAFLFVLYTIILYCIFGRYSLFQAIPVLRKIKADWMLILISFISFTTLLTVISGVVYILFDLDVNVLIPSTIFTLLITIFNLRKRINKL